MVLVSLLLVFSHTVSARAKHNVAIIVISFQGKLGFGASNFLLTSDEGRQLLEETSLFF